jgi:hypothetical protein
LNVGLGWIWLCPLAYVSIMLAFLLQNLFGFLGSLVQKSTAKEEVDLEPGLHLGLLPWAKEEVDLEPGLHLGLLPWAPFTVHIKED